MHSALQLALYRGRASVARTLIAQCEDINATGGHFGNLIQAAAFAGRETMVRWLIDQEVDIHAEGRYGSTLRAASLGGHNAVVHVLLDHGTRINIGQKNALQAAALHGQLATVKLLLARLEEPIQDDVWNSALETASSKGHLDIVRLLLRNRPETSPEQGWKSSRGEVGAMLAAVIAGQESIVHALIEELPRLRSIGRNVVVKCSTPSPQDLLPPESQTDVPSKLSPSIKIAPSNEVGVASIRRFDSMEDYFDWDSLTKLEDIQEGSTVSVQETLRGTPLGQQYLLRIAARQGNKRMIECILACDYELNETGNVNTDLSHQPTALEVAVSNSDLEMIEMLLRKGAVLGKALHFAVRDGNVDVVCMLLTYWPEAELDCFVNPAELQEQYHFAENSASDTYYIPMPPRYLQRRTMSNRSLLAIAVEWRHEEVILALLRHNAGSSHPGLGLSIIVAARNGYEGTIHVLLKYGRAADGFRNTAIISDLLLQQSLREAVESGHLHVVNVLLEQGTPDGEWSQYICIAMCEARIHSRHEITVYLTTLTQKFDRPRLLGDQLVLMASARPAPDCQYISHLETLFDQLSSEKLNSKIYVDFHLRALKGALKAG